MCKSEVCRRNWCCTYTNTQVLHKYKLQVLLTCRVHIPNTRGYNWQSLGLISLLAVERIKTQARLAQSHTGGQCWRAENQPHNLTIILISSQQDLTREILEQNSHFLNVPAGVSWLGGGIHAVM